MEIRVPKKLGKRLWMRRLPLDLRVIIRLRPNHPTEVLYYLTR